MVSAFILNPYRHTIAAAEVNGDLKMFLLWFSNGKQAPNLTKLSNHGMPAGAGKKGGQTARKKKTSKNPVLTDENRVPLNITPLSSLSTSDSRNSSSVSTSMYHGGGDVLVPATCSVINPTEVSHVNTFNNYTGLSGNTWLSSVNSPHYSYSWPQFHSPWSWSQSIPPPPMVPPPAPFGAPPPPSDFLAHEYGKFPHAYWASPFANETSSLLIFSHLRNTVLQSV